MYLLLIVSCEYRILIWNKHLNFSLKIICSNLVDKILETISGPIRVADNTYIKLHILLQNYYSLQIFYKMCTYIHSKSQIA